MWGRPLQGYRRNSVQVSLQRAIKQGLVKKHIKGNQVYLAITKLGEDFLSSGGSGVYDLRFENTDSKLDGFYRLIFFDIPEDHREIRRALRQALRSAKAVLWQRSVWVTKQNITQPLNDFIIRNNLADFVDIVEVKEIYNTKLKKLLD